MAINPQFAVLNPDNMEDATEYHKLLLSITKDLKNLKNNHWSDATNIGENAIYIAWQICTMMILSDDETNLDKLIKVMQKMITGDNNIQ